MSGGRGGNILRELTGNVINIFKKSLSICTAPCDGIIMKLHYQWTFWYLLAAYSSIWFSWFNNDIVRCASQFNAEIAVRMDYINICVSYPYLEDQDDNRRYILYYKWMTWSLLTLAMVYYLPHKLAKAFENTRVKKLMEDLASTSERYDHVQKNSVQRTALYLKTHLHTHNALFFKHLFCNIIALCVDVIAFFGLNFLLQGRFLKYGIMTFPFNRNVDTYDDYMSETFPPFVNCELDERYQLTNRRVERIGCHFTAMELYEKIFFVLWFWLIFLMVITVFYIGFLCTFNFLKVRMLILRISKPANSKVIRMKELAWETIKNCKIGDIYLLYSLREHFSHAMYVELLIQLADPNFTKPEQISIDAPKITEQAIRNRKKSSVKISSRDSLQNTSILIE